MSLLDNIVIAEPTENYSTATKFTGVAAKEAARRKIVSYDRSFYRDATVNFVPAAAEPRGAFDDSFVNYVVYLANAIHPLEPLDGHLLDLDGARADCINGSFARFGAALAAGTEQRARFWAKKVKMAELHGELRRPGQRVANDDDLGDDDVDGDVGDVLSDPGSVAEPDRRGEEPERRSARLARSNVQDSDSDRDSVVER